jgi:L-ascorbate metabolism protein UlaG (beta-lactamase superfamily)
VIPALKKDEVLVAEMDSFMHDETQFYLWWLGQSGFLLQWKGERVLIDPYLSDSLTKKYADTKKPHTRMSERVVAPELLLGISVVTSSHNHTDHLDAETLQPVLKNNPAIRLVIPEANRQYVSERLGIDEELPTGLNDGESVTLGEFTFHGIPARHNEIERDGNGRCRFMGYVIAFGRWKIYHSGDTLWFDEMINLLKPFSVDIAILPINGNDPSRGVAGNLNVKESVELAKKIEAACVIPCHYDMFTFNTADVNEFVPEAERMQQNYSVLKGGERFESKMLIEIEQK